MTKRKPDKEVVCLGSAVGDADDEDDEGVRLVMMRLCECGDDEAGADAANDDVASCDKDDDDAVLW